MIQKIQCFLHFCYSGLKQLLLLYQDLLPGFNGSVALLDQFYIINKHFNWQPRTPHTLDEFNLPYVVFIIISNASFITSLWRDMSNEFIIAKQIRRNVIPFITGLWRDFSNKFIVAKQIRRNAIPLIYFH